MLKAKDIMNTNVVSVRKDSPIFEAVELLVELDISGLPVVEDDIVLVQRELDKSTSMPRDCLDFGKEVFLGITKL